MTRSYVVSIEFCRFKLDVTFQLYDQVAFNILYHFNGITSYLLALDFHRQSLWMENIAGKIVALYLWSTAAEIQMQY